MCDCLDNPAEHWESVARSNFKRIENIEEALKESVKLQSHYAQLLNMYDGGERMQFNNVDEWVDRLRSLKEKKENKGFLGEKICLTDISSTQCIKDAVCSSSEKKRINQSGKRKL